MISVALDGPAGAGKSTIARRAAAELGFVYVDTGAMYRTIGLYCLKNNIDIHNADAVTAGLPSVKLHLAFEEGEQHIYLGDEDVSSQIRTEQVSMAASVVSSISEVRAFLLELQRGLAKTDNIIMDGRDIGTVVLPDAEVKIFLTASPEARAKRRTLQLEEKGETADYETILRDIIQRDSNDSNREIAPLKPAEDSILVDTTELDLEQSINKVIEVIRERAL